MPDLPRPKVEVVTTADSKDHVVISRGDGQKCLTHEIRGDTVNEKITNVVADVLNDRRSGEYLP